MHVSASERTLWNKTAADLSTILGADSDVIINKWDEVVAFLDTYTEADTLANLLSNKVDKTTRVVAGTGLTGGGALTGNVTLSLASRTLWGQTFNGSGNVSGDMTGVGSIDATGNITITRSPARFIAINGDATISLNNSTHKGIYYDTIAKWLVASDGTNTFFEVGNVAIGKKTAQYPLDVAGAIRLQNRLYFGDSAHYIELDENGDFHFSHGVYSDSFLSALGLNPNTGGGGGGSYDRLDTWADYTSERAGWVLSAALGYDLHSRVSSLEGGSALSFTTEGSGNVVTAVKKSGTSVIVTKGLTALTAHQPIYSLAFQAGAFAAKTYTPNTGAQTVNIPTKVSHLSNDSGFITAAALTGYATQSWVKGLGYITASALTPYITAATANATFATKLGVSGNQIGTYVNGKLGNLITVPYAANADTVDGYHETSFFREGRGVIQEADLDTFVSRASGTYNIVLNTFRDSMAVFKSPLSSASALELRFRYSGELWARFSADSNRYSTGWKQLAFTDSNVASATKLQTARKLWGNSFNGEQDVDGEILFAKASGDRQLQLSSAKGVRYIVPSGGWAQGMSWYKSDGSANLGTIGAYGSSDAILYWFIGRSYSDPKLTILPSGYVGVGKVTPNYPLDVAGAVHATTGLFTEGYVSGKGQNTASDARLKTYMEDIELSVQDVANAPAWRYKWKSDGSIDVGSTAQYWAARVPELTHLLADGIHLGLDYGKAALLSVVAVARATADHERRIAALERQLQNRTI